MQQGHATRSKEKSFRTGFAATSLAKPEQISRRMGECTGQFQGTGPFERMSLWMQWWWEVARGTEAVVPELDPAEPPLDSCTETEMPLQRLPCWGPWPD